MKNVIKLAKGSLNNIFQDSSNIILSQQLTHDRSYISVIYIAIFTSCLFQKGSQEYIDATDLLDLYYEIRDELLVETFGDGKEVIDDDDDDGEPDDSHVNLEQIQVCLWLLAGFRPDTLTIFALFISIHNSVNRIFPKCKGYL